jgi:aldose 1-epimerase
MASGRVTPSQVTLAAGDLEASFVGDLSLVGSSLKQRGVELLGLRSGLEAWAQRGMTMGIPLLHPWANRLSDWSYDVCGKHVELPRGSPDVRPEEHGLPIHGLLHGATGWTVTDRSDTELHAKYDFGADRRRMRLFPFAHVISVVASLDPAGLQMTTTVRATGDDEVPIAFGYHPYLQPPGVERALWEIETNVSEQLVLDRHSVPTGEVRHEPVPAGPLGDRAYDNGYQSAAGAWFRVRAGSRTMEIRFLDGYTHAQLFAPATEDVVCFEPMTAPADALRSGKDLRTIAPGESFTASFRVGVSG